MSFALPGGPFPEMCMMKTGGRREAKSIHIKLNKNNKILNLGSQGPQIGPRSRWMSVEKLGLWMLIDGLASFKSYLTGGASLETDHLSDIWSNLQSDLERFSISLDHTHMS